jgi:hypothetical protein
MRQSAVGGILAAPQEHPCHPPAGWLLQALVKETLRCTVMGGVGCARRLCKMWQTYDHTRHVLPRCSTDCRSMYTRGRFLQRGTHQEWTGGALEVEERSIWDVVLYKQGNLVRNLGNMCNPELHKDMLEYWFMLFVLFISKGNAIHFVFVELLELRL